jgi:hypothetical protein
MSLNCSGTPAPCVLALFDNPPDPALPAGAVLNYINTNTNNRPFTALLVSAPSWVSLLSYPGYIEITGTRPNSQGFTITYSITSCGVTTTGNLDYPGPSTICSTCQFFLS